MNNYKIVVNNNYKELYCEDVVSKHIAMFHKIL